MGTARRPALAAPRWFQKDVLTIARDPVRRGREHEPPLQEMSEPLSGLLRLLLDVFGEPVQPFHTSPSGAPRRKMSGKRSPFGVKRSATELMQ